MNNKNRVIADSIPGLLGVHYTYNQQGFLTQTRQRGRVTSFTYNDLGRLHIVTDPLGRTSSMEYDAVGRVTKQTLPDGREINYTGACPEFIEGMPMAI